MANSKPLKITSVRALANLLERSPAHTTVGAWLRRPDWPFATTPPWPLGLVSQIEEWREDTLDEDRNTDQRDEKDRQAKQAKLLPLLGHFRLTAQDMIDPKCPMRAAQQMPQALVEKLTLAELTDLANHLSYGFAVAFDTYVKKTGEADSLPARAAAAYWERIGNAALADAAIAEEWSQYMNRMAWGWAADRFKNKADRAALEKFWEAMPDKAPVTA